MDFLKEYWLWVAVPFGLIALALLALVLMAGDDGTSAFDYPIF